MTDDDIKYHAMEHLLAQGEQSVNEYGTCEYRGPNGNRCAVGFFIDDAEYSLRMEGKDVRHLRQLDLLPTRLHDHLDVLDCLQSVHDHVGQFGDNFAASFEATFHEPYPTFRARYLANKQETVDA